METGEPLPKGDSGKVAAFLCARSGTRQGNTRIYKRPTQLQSQAALTLFPVELIDLN